MICQFDLIVGQTPFSAKDCQPTLLGSAQGRAVARRKTYRNVRAEFSAKKSKKHGKTKTTKTKTYHALVPGSPVRPGRSGKEGKTASSPAISLAAATSKKVALRLVGLHSTNGTFAIKDSAGNLKSFTIYVQDGRALPTPKTVTSVDISPGQRFDVLTTLPTTSGTWYPQVTYKRLRDNSPYATVYGKITF
ncbi:hypothetical protein [Methylocaldum sp. 14B]|uniref:hypothetical protein n=1 Tax=Methylocaldum sp. 14B TaxID=1912213 RepID=UPI0023E4568D|nr:hypothetical protein [Methylocaldum sp. 14B]